MKDISSSQKASKTDASVYKSRKEKVKKRKNTKGPIVTLVPLYKTDRSSFIQMCIDYNVYLSCFLSHPISDDTKDGYTAFADKVISCNSECYVDMLYTPFVPKAIGFIIYSEKVFRSNQYFDYFIDELYILPEYQSKGFGQAAAKRYMSNVVSGKLGLYILKKNEKAYDFWCKFFSSQNITLDNIPLSGFDSCDTNLFCCSLV